MSYSYDRTRTAGDKIWMDIQREVQEKFCEAAVKAIASQLGGTKTTTRLTGFGEATGEMSGKPLKVTMFFRGGEAYSVALEIEGPKKFKLDKELSQFTPDTYADYILRALKEKGWKID